MQIILCSDGIISFVILLYDYPGRVVLNETLPIGFYAGDLSRRLVISQRSEIQAKNIFRIDGKQVDTVEPLLSGLPRCGHLLQPGSYI